MRSEGPAMAIQQRIQVSTACALQSSVWSSCLGHGGTCPAFASDPATSSLLAAFGHLSPPCVGWAADQTWPCCLQCTRCRVVGNYGPEQNGSLVCKGEWVKQVPPLQTALCWLASRQAVSACKSFSGTSTWIGKKPLLLRSILDFIFKKNKEFSTHVWCWDSSHTNLESKNSFNEWLKILTFWREQTSMALFSLLYAFAIRELILQSISQMVSCHYYTILFIW